MKADIDRYVMLLGSILKPKDEWRSRYWLGKRKRFIWGTGNVVGGFGEEKGLCNM